MRYAGMVIVTDGRAGYDNVKHEVILHAEHFVDNINQEINTQAIKGL